MSSTLPLRQLRSLMQPTGSTISSLCEKEGLSHETISVDAGEFNPATLHFIGCGARTPGNVLLYFHGGGYIFPLTPGHFKFARAAAGKSNLVILEYTLAPELKYPGQLAQAAAALRYLLEQHDASEITVAGDSAGGNLTLAVLAHLRQPHPRIQPVFEGEQKQLRGALCISPRCANDCTALSYTLNAHKDIISSHAMELFTSRWEPVKEDVWATPLAGVGDFWANVHAKRVLIVAGTDEVYVDDIKQFGQVIGSKQQTNSKVELVICGGEIHVQAVFDHEAGNWDGAMLKVVLRWLQDLEGDGS